MLKSPSIFFISRSIEVFAISLIGCFIVVKSGNIFLIVSVPSYPTIFKSCGIFMPLFLASFINAAANKSFVANIPSTSGCSSKILLAIWI